MDSAGDDEYIYVKSEYKLIQISLKDILYIEGLKDYVKIYVETEARPIMSLMSLKSLKNVCRLHAFCACIVRTLCRRARFG